ncbi:MAG: Spy/CpxP family protein refolding chaperone [Melioribacteraceae bacterium]|nr:Spy/CpxP family protein refolding chaperone [Melioribacteraceae bacterium]
MKKSLLILVIAFTFSSLLVSQPRQKYRDSRAGFEKQRLSEQLNLTEEQQDKIDQLRFDHQNGAIDIRSEINKNRLKLRKMMKDGEINKDEYFALVEKNNQLNSKLKTSRAQLFLGIYELLDDNQKEIWIENRQMNRMHRDGFRGNNRPHSKMGRFFDNN